MWKRLNKGLFIGAVIVSLFSWVANGKTVLTHLTYPNHGEPWQEFVRSQALAFERANPDIKIDLVVGSGVSKFMTMVAGGVAPDITEFALVYGGTLAADGHFLDLRPFFARDRQVNLNHYAPIAIQAMTASDGAMWGFPADVYPASTYYDVDKGGKNDLNASLALGGLTKGVTPLELTAAYAPFANGGVYTEPYAISRVEDRDGVVLYEAKTVTRTAMSDALAFVMTDMMRGVIERGTGRRAAIGRPAAGKTGTTSDYTNAWFTGYTPQLVATIWIGNDLQREPMTSATGNIGSAKAAEIWASFMKQALAGHPVEDFKLPQSGLVGPLAIDRSNGLLVPQGCQLPPTAVTQEYFIEASAPQAITPRCR
jgi:hypothetical protein